VATDVDHGVDAAGAAQHLAARLVHGPATHMRLGHGIVIPVGRAAKQLGEGRRDVDVGRAILAAGLQQQYPLPGIG